ncbi:type II toxin-antitoxin system RelE/ParE family toxin [Sphingopyxis terrae]|uniref:type II toxin-antitoxin system RelE/ParE family toxin n=1 Tax=Sphingopyxis terrae TaxID=33052 RepID=UPI001C2BFE49|nr:type II toxin-antitoxin system RelE/ParE family toxin [Sphingopyxis terrae]QXF12345.1 type II toxin-antitoxin system RelE/ParE family toxin [Sphingopyxis terrae subsp. terrae]
MKKREVVLSPEARADLLALYDWIADAASPDIALGYVERIEAYIRGFDVASERGTARDDIREGLRITGFKRRVTIAFNVTNDQVIILRFFYGGQDWEAHLGDDPDLQ